MTLHLRFIRNGFIPLMRMVALRSFCVSNKKSSDGIEQIDFMPDGTYRCTFWKGAKTLDDLRKKPNEVKISKQNDFKE